YWSSVKLALQTVGVQLGLLLSCFGAFLRSLSFYDCERQTVGTPKHIVDEALPSRVRHGGDLVFQIIRSIECPTRFTQQKIDKMVTSLGFRILVLIDNVIVLLLCSGDFLAQPR